jgi:hypothetical protein
MLSEVLAIVRGIAGTNWRAEKTLQMQHLIYRAVLGSKPGTVREMRDEAWREAAIERFLTQGFAEPTAAPGRAVFRSAVERALRDLDEATAQAPRDPDTK